LSFDFKTPKGTTAMTNPKTPDGGEHHTLTAALAVRGAARALEFYAQAFGAQEIFRAPGPDGKIAHAQMRIGDSLFFLADEDPSIPHGYRSPQSLSGTSCAIYMYVADADAVFEQAVRAGAEGLFPVADQHWGDREGLVRDPFGHLWALAMRK
jgi:PhnB protein